jgi:hypothetical protein
MDEHQIVLLLRRIKQSQDGPQFIEYLEMLQQENYQRFKKSSGEDVFVTQGYALCVDSLLQSLAECSKDLESNSSLTTWAN